MLVLEAGRQFPPAPGAPGSEVGSSEFGTEVLFHSDHLSSRAHFFLPFRCVPTATSLRNCLPAQTDQCALFALLAQLPEVLHSASFCLGLCSEPGPDLPVPLGLATLSALVPASFLSVRLQLGRTSGT